MSDARSLLRAKRQEARVTHPYAAYSSTGQLRCTICAIAVKQASMWEGHLGSKVHRTNVMKEKEREKQQEELARQQALEEQEQEDEPEEDEEDAMPPLKRKMEDVRLDEGAPKKRKADDVTQPSTNASQPSGFPADFFSDPSRAPVLGGGNEDDEDPKPAEPVLPQIDLELQQFEASIANVNEEREEERRDLFNRATVFAEPEIVSQELEGIPHEAVEDGPEILVPKRDETAEEKRERLEREGREEIMDRLLEEERAQEEADSRVELLKAKVEALKRAREERKANGQKKAR